ncbi:MAG: zinc metalloprotease HtpX [Candidatus Aenigmatarchaeota archaeon]
MSGKLYATMALTIILLFGILFAILVAVGMYFSVSSMFMVPLMIVIIVVQWAASPKLVWAMTGLRLLEKDELNWLRESIAQICKKNNVRVPRIAISKTDQPNAFVFGRTSRSATLAVTQGLLDTLTKDEVKAVVGHEIGHIKHNDMVVMTVASAVPMITYYIGISLMFSGDSRRGDAAIFGIIAFAVYFLSNLLVMSLSRLREYHSDEFGGRVTKPGDLASALAKITYGLAKSRSKNKNNAVRSFYIADPINSAAEISQFSDAYADRYISKEEVRDAMAAERSSGSMKFLEIFRTHPLTVKRIEALHKLDDKINEEGVKI